LKYHSIQHIACENAWQKMWDHYLFFETEPTVRGYLAEQYRSLGYENSDALAYRNTYKMIYLSKQAREFFHSGVNSSLLVRPLLLYYGMVSLAKMLILSRDPDYPSRTSLLAHGVTTKKIKKSQYLFLEDEVKIQKEGLLAHLMQLITGVKIKGDYQIKELITLIPELSSSYTKLYREERLISVYVSDEINAETKETTIFLPLGLLDYLGFGMKEFSNWVNQYNEDEVCFTEGEMYPRENIFSLKWKHPAGIHVLDHPDGFSNHLFLKDVMGHDYFWTKPEEKLLIPEIMVHFLIMYLLGMLCRYEGDLWGEIHFSFYSQDLYLIHEFIHNSPRKFPNLILNMLFNEIYYFHK